MIQGRWNLMLIALAQEEQNMLMLVQVRHNYGGKTAGEKKKHMHPKPLGCMGGGGGVGVCVCVHTTCILSLVDAGWCVCVFRMEGEYSWMCPRHICQKISLL